MRKSFKATCKLPVPKPVQDLTEEDERVRGTTAVKHKGEWCALVPHAHEFTDPDLFDQHMKDVHAKRVFNGPNTALVRSTRVKYKAPRLTEEGLPFEPGPDELGGHLDVPGYGRCQVWSLAHNKRLWVVPCEPVGDVSAVLVHKRAHVVFVDQVVRSKRGAA